MAREAIELFAGAGGMGIGFERAGFHVVRASDLMPQCVRTLCANQARGIAVPEQDRTYLQGAEILQEDVCDVDFTKWKGIDCVFGGPPCQAFSSSGKGLSLEDERGRLVLEFVRAIDEARPARFVLENVRGLATARDLEGRPGGVLLDLLARFERLGYGVRATILNAADYGAFQRRVRLFITGSRNTSPPGRPEPTHGRIEAPTLEAVLPWRTLGDFLDLHADQEAAHWVRPTERLEQALRGVKVGSGLKSAGVVESTRPGGHWGYRQGTFIADPDLPARTVTGSSTQDWIRLDDGSLRRLTENEVAGLQGFPSRWGFEGTKSQRFQMIGNAVPAGLAAVVAETLLVETGATPTIQIDPKIESAIRYTRSEERRNGESRRRKMRSTRKLA